MNFLATIQTFIQRAVKPAGIPKLNPSRDWILLLVCGLAVLLASLLWNGWYFFFELTKESAPQVSVEQAVVDTASLEKIEAAFNKRKGEAERYLNEYRFVDPSR